METTQDRQIREKLNSLDTLPEGYAPSLDSKWELLLAGKPEEKPRTPYFWYAAAASLLLLLSFGFLFFSKSIEPKETTIANTKIAVPKPETIADPTPETVAVFAQKPTETIAAATPEKVIANPVIISKNARAKTIKTPAAANNFVVKNTSVIPENSVQLSEPTGLTPATEPVLATSEVQKIACKKKTTFIEMDFEAPKPARNPRPQTQTAQINFKLKLLPKATETSATVVQNEKPFRLQHTF